jgi:hypothetical protein
MKTFALRTCILALFLGSFVVACSSDDGSTSSGGTSGGTSSGGTSSGGTSSGGTSSGGTSSGDTEQAGTGKVTLSREGSEVVAYDARNTRAIWDEPELHFELMSGDTKHVVSVNIHGTAPGTYKVGVGLDDATAGVLMYSEGGLPSAGDAPGVFHGEEGTVTLTASNGRAVGSFTATAKHGIDDRTYLVEGTFDLPIMEAGGDE